jgi:hypothetical protein
MKYLIICSFLLLPFYTTAQLPQAFVYTIIGEATSLHNGKQSVLKQGSYIFYGDVITAKNKAVITLLNDDRKFIIVNKPGKYTYEELLKTISGKVIGITEAYFKLLWKEFFSPQSQLRVSPQAIGLATGGASRGGCDFLINPPSRIKTVADTLFFQWNILPGAKTYRFTLKKNGDEEIINIITKDTSLMLLKRGLMAEDSNTYYWGIMSEPVLNGCNESLSNFTIFTVRELQKQINRIVNSVPPDADLFLYNIAISNLLGVNGWQEQAYQYYLKAMAASPLKE